MKKTLLGWMLLVCLLCISAASMAAYDERLPAGVNEILSGRAWDSYEVTKVDGHTEWGASRMPRVNGDLSLSEKKLYTRGINS